MKTVKDLIENYDQIENCYRGNMEKQLFSLSVPDFQRLSASQLEDEFRVFIERGDPCFWGVWLRAKAIQGIGVDFDTAVETAVGMVSHREQKARIRRYFHQCRMDALALPDDTKRQTMGQLYTELKTKTLSA
jgi:phage anti-repressor protein